MAIEEINMYCFVVHTVYAVMCCKPHKGQLCLCQVYIMHPEKKALAKKLPLPKNRPYNTNTPLPPNICFIFLTNKGCVSLILVLLGKEGMNP